MSQQFLLQLSSNLVYSLCRVNRRHQTMYLMTHRSSRRGLIGDLLLFMCWTYSLCCTYACNALVVDTLNSNLMLVLWYDICVPLWIIVMYVICGVWRWYIYVIYVLCNISMLWNISVLWYIYVLRNVMQKQKKIHISEALPSVMTKTLGKANTICRVLSPRHSAKSYF